MGNIIWAFKSFGFITGLRFTFDYLKLGTKRFFSRKHKEIILEHHDMLNNYYLEELAEDDIEEVIVIKHDKTVN